jgi:hypothetical protein
VEYIDDTKIELQANKYTFVWRKSVEKKRVRLMKKISVLPAEVCVLHTLLPFFLFSLVMILCFSGRKSRTNISILYEMEEEVIKNISTLDVDKCSTREASCCGSGEWGVHIVVLWKQYFFGWEWTIIRLLLLTLQKLHFNG